MQSKSVKRIFIFIIVILPLQYALVGLVEMQHSEPWPAMVLPAFKSVYGSNGKIAVDQVKFYVENNKNAKLIEIQPGTLFEGINKSQLQGFFRTHFSDSAAVAAFSNETKKWLRKKIEKQYPSLTVDRLHVHWRQKIFRASGRGPAQAMTKPVQQFSVSLRGG